MMNSILFTSSFSTERAAALGFRGGDVGTHSSRTLMFAELESLFSYVSDLAPRERYATAIIDDNCLGKQTGSTRRLTNQRLAELYALDPQVPLFRVLRYLWSLEVESRPLLSLAISLARDPLLAATAEVILNLRIGSELPRAAMKQALLNHVGERMNEASIDKVVRNASSSWTQSGHLEGRTFKVRRRVNATPATIALALLLATAAGFDGMNLFSSPWVGILDCPPTRAHDLALEAKRQGLIDLRLAGDVVELDVSRIDPQSSPLRAEAKRWAV